MPILDAEDMYQAAAGKSLDTANALRECTRYAEETIAKALHEISEKVRATAEAVDQDLDEDFADGLADWLDTTGTVEAIEELFADATQRDSWAAEQAGWAVNDDEHRTQW